MAIKLLFHGTVKEGQEGAFRDLAGRAMALAREEPGTTGYEWWLDEDGRFVSADTLTDSAALFAHVGRAQAAGLADEYLRLTQIERIQIFGEVDDEVREALENWRPEYYSLVAGF